VDGAAAWCVEICDQTGGGIPPRPQPLVSTGAELGVNAGFFFLPPVALRFGAAVPLRRAYGVGGVEERPDPQLYFVVGRSY